MPCFVRSEKKIDNTARTGQIIEITTDFSKVYTSVYVVSIAV